MAGGSLGQVYHDNTLKNRQPKQVQEEREVFTYNYITSQVFTSAAASGILTNDLVSIMESREGTAVLAGTVQQ